ncbi:MAG: hypothetical protein JRN06_09850 [Nitrososphaerota archaeon]|nr:hypothetical protein [Nitrososphaerota archaeon]MDG7024889.1 hypothetical protein [Nitrososphaerota archaeon]
MPRKSDPRKRAARSAGRKKIVRDFFRLVTQGKQRDGLSLFASDCRQHNPYVRGGMEDLFESMSTAQREAPK